VSLRVHKIIIYKLKPDEYVKKVCWRESL